MQDDVLSVGIDIGTSTTQLVFSRLHIANTASGFAIPRLDIVDAEILYQSGIHLTPLRSETLIDSEAVREIVAAEFRQAGFSPRDTGTGAVIVTGETARKENARAVLESLSGFAGEFVVYTAGPDLESVIAGKGAGAQRHARKHSCVVANLDIGGGTTNIAVFDCGALAAKGCLDIGGRLVKLAEDGTVTYLSPRLLPVLEELGLSLRVGDRADPALLERVAARMNGVLEEVLGLRPATPLAETLRTAGSTALELPKPVDYFSFSGGVADCMDRPAGGDPFPYGDMGLLLGRAVAAGALCRAGRVLASRETIRATVIGAGVHTVSLSGSTITYDQEVLPAKNLPVLTFSPEEEARLLEGDGALLAGRIRWFLEQSGGDNLLIALAVREPPGFHTLQALSRCIAQGADTALPQGKPVLAAVRTDIAKALGQQIDAVLGGRRSVVCIDSVELGTGDYVDLGAPLAGGLVIPVVVKTLLFG